MSQETESTQDRKELPIERGFPIRQLNDISEKESYGGARQWYRPIYTMHKWWARRLGSVFRAICLYTLVDDPEDVEVYEPGQGTKLDDFNDDYDEISEIFEEISLEKPDSLWKLYPKDVRVKDKKILDPFMGGGTSIVEASRFGVECHGRDLNPVAWFVTKKQLEAGSTDVEELEAAYEKIESELKEKLKGYYKTPCPNEPDDHEADVMNSFWVKQLDCVSCGNTVSLFKDYRVGKGRYENKGKYNVFCPDCEGITLVEDWKSESVCDNCQNEFVPQDGPASGGDYTCQSCGQKYGMSDAVQEQNGFDLKYYSIEYHCPTCDEKGREDVEVKSYKSVETDDRELFEKAKQEWEARENLHEYVPDESIPLGVMTDSSAFEGSIGGGHNLLDHGYNDWTDMFNERQLLCFSLLLREIDSLDDQNAKEYLLLSLSDSLKRNTMMVGYSEADNQVADLFRVNAFDTPVCPTEGNIWGADYGTCTFESTWDKIIRGIKWANSPTDRYIQYPKGDNYPRIPRNENLSSPETIETEPFDFR
jgi:adenine-specific DNA methylase